MTKSFKRNCLGYYVENPQDTYNKHLVHMAETKYNKFNIKLPVKTKEPTFDFIPQLPKGFKNFREFFDHASTELYGKDIDYLEELYNHYVDNGIPQAVEPANIKMLAGWARYDKEGKFDKLVRYPYERCIVYDVETFVKGGAYPIIGTATGKNHSYIWIAKEFIEKTKVEDYDQLDLIPLSATRLLVGFNISYDLNRTREAYSLYNNLKFFDCMSGHIVCSGFASGQRYMDVLRNKAPESLTVQQRVMLQNSPDWADSGSTNSLVAAYNFHVARVNEWFGTTEVEKIKPEDKKIRNVFVDTNSMDDFVDMGDFRYNLLHYASKDTYYTAHLFKSLYPKYKQNKKSVTNLAGHLALSESRVPLRDDWLEWINICEGILKDDEEFVTNLLKEEAWNIFNKWLENPDEVEKDFFYGQLDWTIKRRKNPKNRPDCKAITPKWIENPKPKTWSYIPKWFYDIWAKPHKRITTKSDISHILLRLHWEGNPLYKTPTNGWVYYDSTGVEVKVPHKVNPGANVGNVLGKNYVDDIEEGILTGEHPKVKEVFDVAIRDSFWISNRKRVMDLIVRYAPNKLGEDFLMAVPQFAPNGKCVPL